jgi:hypothetical protein
MRRVKLVDGLAEIFMTQPKYLSGVPKGEIKALKIVNGVTRTVIIFKKHVLKTPSIKNGWLNFIHGIESNLQERTWSGFHQVFAKVIRSSKLGFWLIMEKAEPVPKGANWEDIKDYLSFIYHNEDIFEFIMSDCKKENWGLINGKLVKIDYA